MYFRCGLIVTGWIVTGAHSCCGEMGPSHVLHVGPKGVFFLWGTCATRAIRQLIHVRGARARHVSQERQVSLLGSISDTSFFFSLGRLGLIRTQRHAQELD